MTRGVITDLMLTRCKQITARLIYRLAASLAHGVYSTQCFALAPGQRRAVVQLLLLARDRTADRTSCSPATIKMTPRSRSTNDPAGIQTNGRRRRRRRRAFQRGRDMGVFVPSSRGIVRRSCRHRVRRLISIGGAVVLCL